MAANDPIADIRFECQRIAMFDDAKHNAEAALSALYREFAATTPDIIEGCPCCIATRGTDVLLNTPLRQITGQQIWRYVSGAFLTVGNVADFRYFLPRILEISFTDPGNANDAEIVLAKLGMANWTSWSPSERRAIEFFIDAWFDWSLVNDLAYAECGTIGWETESVMCGAARAGLSLDRWSDKLRSAYAAPFLDNWRERFPHHLSSFWEDAPTGKAEIMSILFDSGG